MNKSLVNTSTPKVQGVSKVSSWVIVLQRGRSDPDSFVLVQPLTIRYT